MSEDSRREEAAKEQIRELLPYQGLGTGNEVVCDNCSRTIEVSEVAKGYVTGDLSASQWKIARLLHTDCSKFFTEERIGEHDETEAIIYGKLIRDPRVAFKSAVGREEGKEEMNRRFRERGLPEPHHIDAPLPKHRLKNVEVAALHIMSDEEVEERRETYQTLKDLLDMDDSDDE